MKHQFTLTTGEEALAPGPREVRCVDRVLVVDDNDDTLQMYTTVLSVNGYEPARASSGAQALAVIRESPPDIIVTDLAMPGMDGLQLVEALRRSNTTRTLPVVLLTGHSLVPDDADRLRAAGCCALLMKPCPPDDFIDAIVSLLGTCSQQCATCPVPHAICIHLPE